MLKGKIIGVEALARWEHPEHGYIPPDIFIQLAEQAGMITALTDWVVKTALKQSAIWKESKIQLNMAINLSARNLQDEHLPDLIMTQLSTNGIAPNMLTLEITESSIMLDPNKSMNIINTLSNWGINMAVDDFGTGYSSLAYLKKLSVNELKIDRSFIKNMFSDIDDQTIVRSTIELAHNLNLVVVAEGVEDVETYNILKEYGCDHVQGYYICKPISTTDFTKWLEQHVDTSGHISQELKLS